MKNNTLHFRLQLLGFIIMIACPLFGFQERLAGAVEYTERLSAYYTALAAGNDTSYAPILSIDGRYVSFTSDAGNLVSGDTNGVEDIFVHDRETGQTARVSVDSMGVEGNAGSMVSAISADGRYVAFESLASNLVVGDTNGVADIFVHDRSTGQTTRVSVDSAGVEGNASSGYPSGLSFAISADGRYVSFTSDADNLVSGDTNGRMDVFIHDRETGQTSRVSVNSEGIEVIADSRMSGLSADGRFVSFESGACYLVANDFNGVRDIFVHDRLTGETTCVSVDSAGIQADNYSEFAAISADGRYVAFESLASNLVAGDTNGVEDIFVHDRETGQTSRVSVDSVGIEGNAENTMSSISADGRYVAFNSAADNLVSGDTNGDWDIFIYDRETGQTSRASVDSTGNQGNGYSTRPFLSPDGSCVTFHSFASNLVAGDTNGEGDVFVHDQATGMTTRESFGSMVTEGNQHSTEAAVSADGRYVAFESFADNLVIGDTNSRADIFVHDRLTGMISRVSLNSAGGEAHGNSQLPAISPDGRYVAFSSSASDLTAGDSNGQIDIFFRDRLTGMTTRVSVTSAGTEANGGSYNPVLSADGRFIAFHSGSTNLMTGDANGVDDVFVHDRMTGQTTCVSVDSAGIQGNNHSQLASLSADGRFVAFQSSANNLVVGDTYGVQDVFVHDRLTGETARVSVDSSGVPGNATSRNVSISDDGRYMAFESSANNLVVGDTYGVQDIFVHDRLTGETARVSVDSSGNQANAPSDKPSISADGSRVAFSSGANNLVSGDTWVWDVFVHDRTTGQTTRASTDSFGAGGNNTSNNASLSADGRFVAFESWADNLVMDDDNSRLDIFGHVLSASLCLGDFNGDGDVDGGDLAELAGLLAGGGSSLSLEDFAAEFGRTDCPD